MSDLSAEPKRYAAPIAPDALLAFALLLAGAIVFLWYAPASYQIYLALHILAVTIWVGGDITLTTLGIVFEQQAGRPDARRARAHGRLDRHPRLHAHALLRLRVRRRARREVRTSRGISSGSSSRSSAGRSRRLIGIAFVGPELGRIDRAAQEFGPESPEVARRVKRLFTIFRFDTALLVLVVLDMAAKPTF